jgi:hypothetical protein
MTLKQHRLLQWLVITLLLFAGTGGYFYYQSRAAVTEKRANNNGLVGYWSFDEGSGTKAGDASGQGNTGTLTNMEARDWVDGARGKALSFDGVDDYVDVPHDADFNGTSGISISFWVNYSSSSATLTGPLQKGAYTSSGWDIVFHRTNRNVNLRFAGSVNDHVSSNNMLALDTWQHVVITFDPQADAVKFYFNGVYDKTVTDTGSIVGNTTALSFGSGVYAKLLGSLDEVRIYNRALGASEITSLYQLSAAKLAKNQQDAMTNGLVGYWSFNGQDISGTTAYDRSGQGNNGTLTNGPTPTFGKVGQALSFDGTDDYIDAGNNSSVRPSFPFSVSSWMKLSSLASSTPILTSSDVASSGIYSGFTLLVATDGSIEARVGNDGGCVSWARKSFTTSSGVITTGAWYHVSAVFTDINTFAIYVNGVNQTGTLAGESDTIAYAAGNKLRIGVMYDTCSSVSRYANGVIDEPRIYNRALSADEVKNLYDLGTPQTVNASQNSSMTSGLVGEWSFNGADISGTTAYDRSGSGNNGTLTNGPTPTFGKVGQALSFDGTDDYISVADPASGVLDFGTGDFSISVWVKVMSSNSGRLINKWNGSSSEGWILDVNTTTGGSNSAGHIRFRMRDTAENNFDYAHNVSIHDGEWHHIAVSLDRDSTTGLVLYKDGAVAGAAQDPTSVSGSLSIAGALNMGALPSVVGGEAYFSGSIDEVRIYNRALSAAEITALYNQGR